MTLTDRSMEWLDQNRHRAYPAERDAWRAAVGPSSGLDAVLLDALVLDSDAAGDESLAIESVAVSSASTAVSMRYGDTPFQIELAGGETSGDGSYVLKKGAVRGSGRRPAYVSLAFSSHAFVLDAVGEGTWRLGAPILRSRVVALSRGAGADGIVTNGSDGVAGHAAAVASGEVVLEDGYRTSPIVRNGKVFVRTGKRYGYDPCTFDFGEDGTVDCRKPLLFFCGQNAINGGNVVLKGGKGVTVSSGRKYAVRSGTCAGKEIPCVEIVACAELRDLFSPEKKTS